MSIHFHSIAGDRSLGYKYVSDAKTPEYKDEEYSCNYGFDPATLQDAVHEIIDDKDDNDEGGWVRSSEVVRHPAHHHVARRDSWPFGTYKFHEVPPNFKEPFIFTGYRSPTSTKFDCIKYCFTRNNEMMNVWTHFIPFVATTWYIFKLWLVDEYDFVNDSYTWPLLTYLISCCVYPFISAFAHCFDCVSARARHVMFFMDYSAIAMYGLATCIAHYAYSFPREFNGTSLKFLYVPIAFYNACFMPVLSCESRFIEFSPYCKKFRLLAFVIPAAWGTSPMLYRLFFASHKANNFTPEVLRYHQMQFLTGAVSSVLYGFRFPEAFFPGKCDVFFHSHQIFHVFCSMSTIYQMWGVMGDFHYFKGQPHHDPSVFTFKWSLGLYFIGLLWCAIVIRCCQKRVYCFKPEQLHNMLLHVPRVTCSKKGTFSHQSKESHLPSSPSSSSSSSDTSISSGATGTYFEPRTDDDDTNDSRATFSGSSFESNDAVSRRGDQYEAEATGKNYNYKRRSSADDVVQVRRRERPRSSLGN